MTEEPQRLASDHREDRSDRESSKSPATSMRDDGYEFGPRSLIVAIVAATTQIALTVAFTSLVFRNELAGGFSLGLASMFAGLCIAGVLGAMRSGLGGHVIGPQDSGVVVLSAAVPTIAASAGAPAATMIVLMGLSSVLVGLVVLVLGRLGWGRSVRFLPFPVLAGFLAGTGLVIGRSSIELAWEGLTGFAAGGTDRWLRMIVAVLVALAMTAISRSSLPTERFLPALVLGSLVVFHIARVIDGMSRADGAARGWLLPTLPDGSLITSAWWESATNADWSVVWEQSPTVLPLIILAPVTMLLYLGALESILDTDVDTDREFRSVGVSNLAAGAVGAAPSYTQFANTMLVQRMSGRNRAVPLLIGLAAILVLAVGDVIVGLVPQPIVAGLLGFIAISFVLDWAWDLRTRVNRVELAISLAIAASILVLGFPIGLGLGLALSLVWFVIQSGRISGIRRLGDAATRRSTVDRTPLEERVLADRGARVVISELSGYLFFGTGDSIFRRLRARAAIDDVRWLVFDLSRVSRADSSAVASFGPLLRWAAVSDIAVAWCNLSVDVRRSLSPLFDGERGGREFSDLDRALEWTESCRLEDSPPDTDRVVPPSLLDVVPELRDAAIEVRYETGQALRRMGERGRGLAIIESGHVTVEGGAEGSRRRRLGPGAVLGEVSLYRDDVVTATVVADEQCTALEIDRRGTEELAGRDPAAAGRLHAYLAGILADRLVGADRIIDAYRAAETEPDVGAGR